MEQFLRTLLIMSATASVAAAVVMLLRLPLKRAPRWITCGLWLVVLFRMLCPVSFQAPVSMIPQSVTQGSYTAPLLTPQTIPPVSDPVVSAPETPRSAESAPSEPAAASSPTRPQVLLTLWAVGTAGMLLWSALSYGRLRRRLADAVLTGENIYQSDRVDTPFLCGLLRPRIYLPADLDPADRKYVLLHEQTHIRRRDYFIKPLFWLALCLHWFNPVLWVAYRLFCRDVESACDQATVKPFDREDTAGYAAALLRLGRRRVSPQSIPLSFGEDDPKGRIREVLADRKTFIGVVIAAVLVAIFTGLLLLANPAEGEAPTLGGPQLEGVAITGSRLVCPDRVAALPQDLLDRLTNLLRTHGHEDYVPLDSYEPTPNAVTLHCATDGTAFYFDPDSLTLTRVNHDGYSSIRKQAPMKASLARDPDFRTWLEEYHTFRSYGWADAIYDLAHPSIGDAGANAALLREAYATTLEYTLELATEAEPYGITLNLTDFPAFTGDQTAELERLRRAGTLFLALVDNAGTFTASYPSPLLYDEFSVRLSSADPAPELPKKGFTLAADSDQKGLTREEFRALYDELCQDSLPATPVEFSCAELLYLRSDPRSEEDVAAQHAEEALTGTFSVYPYLFTAAVPWAETTAIETVHYRNTTGPLPLLADDGSSQADTVWVLDENGEDTGFRLYELDGEYYAAHYTGTGLEYLFRIAPRTTWTPTP
ncbi:MAG: DUF4825 domain-containing protein [Ruminiclostridium sp.]|nr:DUF4825 domain-containing protein [Ruminiclostridium sp.]